MELSDGIRKIGFRRWYERQLIESHLYLISGFMCLVTVLACLEGFSFRTPAWETVMRFAAMMAGAAICLWTVRPLPGDSRRRGARRGALGMRDMRYVPRARTERRDCAPPGFAQ